MDPCGCPGQATARSPHHSASGLGQFPSMLRIQPPACSHHPHPKFVQATENIFQMAYVCDHPEGVLYFPKPASGQNESFGNTALSQLLVKSPTHTACGFETTSSCSPEAPGPLPAPCTRHHPTPKPPGSSLSKGHVRPTRPPQTPRGSSAPSHPISPPTFPKAHTGVPWLGSEAFSYYRPQIWGGGQGIADFHTEKLPQARPLRACAPFSLFPALIGAAIANYPQ